MDINFDFLRELEGFKTEGYLPKDRDGKIFGQSGVTVGSGIDLGQWSEREFKRMGVPDNILQQLSPYFEKKTTEAEDFLRDNPLRLSRQDAEQLTTIVKDHFATEVAAWYNKGNTVGNTWDDLDERQRTVITSVSFQYGIGDKGAPNFKKQVLDNDWGSMVENLRAFVPSGDYQARRNKEIQYLVGLDRRSIDGVLGPVSEAAIANYSPQPEPETPPTTPSEAQGDPLVDQLLARLTERLSTSPSPSQRLIEQGPPEGWVHPDLDTTPIQWTDAERDLIQQAVDYKVDEGLIRQEQEEGLALTYNEAMLGAEAQAAQSEADQQLERVRNERGLRTTALRAEAESWTTAERDLIERASRGGSQERSNYDIVSGRRDPIYGIF